MHLPMLAPILIGAALLIFITLRQLTWQSVRLGKLLRMPLILAVGGVASFSSPGQQLPAGWRLDALDVIVIVVELLVAVAVGWALGRSTIFRTAEAGTQSRLSGAGLAVWLAFIAARIGLGIATAGLHAPLVSLTGTILLVVAVLKLTQAVVIRERLARHHAAQGDRPGTRTEPGDVRPFTGELNRPSEHRRSGS